MADVSPSESQGQEADAAERRSRNAKAMVEALSQSGIRAADMVQVVLALADDKTPSQFTFLAKKGKALSAGMTTAQLGDYIAEHRTVRAERRVDREYVRDYIIKVLLAAGVVEMGVAKASTGDVSRGRHDPKSANNCYLLTRDAEDLLEAADLGPGLKHWIDTSPQRQILAEEQRLRAQAAGVAASSHAQMIDTTIKILVENDGPLSNYELVYKDVGDDSRIPERMQARIKELRIPLDLESKWPDIILYDAKADIFRLIEVVKSDGEMSTDRVASLRKSWGERGLTIVAFTTVYADWPSAARRQSKERNLAPGSELFILDDPVRIWSTALMSSIS